MKLPKKEYKWLIFLLLNAISLISYSSLSADSLNAQKDTIQDHKRKLSPAFDFDQRFSFIRNSVVNIWGERVGILVNEKFKVGLGGYFLGDKLKSKKVDANGNSLTYGKRNLYFATVYFEPFLFRKKYWELSIPFEAGFGESYFRVYDACTNNFLGSSTTYFIPTGAGLSLSLKMPAFGGCRPFRWIGINFLVGYRYDVKESLFGTNYDGTYWSISGAIFLDRVIDDCRYWKKKKEERKKLRP